MQSAPEHLSIIFIQESPAILGVCSDSSQHYWDDEYETESNADSKSRNT